MAVLMEYASATKLLAKYGIRTTESTYVSSADEAVKFSGGKPIVLKGITEKAIHKTKSGLIAVDLSDERELLPGLILAGSALKSCRFCLSGMA